MTKKITEKVILIGAIAWTTLIIIMLSEKLATKINNLRTEQYNNGYVQGYIGGRQDALYEVSLKSGINYLYEE